MPNICVREYNPDSGALLGNITTLKFGRVAAGTNTRVKVIDIAFDGVSSVGNIKLGLISAGGVIVNADPQDRNADQSTITGNFGVESSFAFDSTKASEPLTRNFGGLNSTASSNSENNVYIGLNQTQRSPVVSNYIYLDIKVSSTLVGAVNGAYKVFFDYS
jgi:hypothetical protein